MTKSAKTSLRRMKIADIEKTDILVGDWGIPSHLLFLPPFCEQFRNLCPNT